MRVLIDTLAAYRPGRVDQGALGPELWSRLRGFAEEQAPRIWSKSEGCAFLGKLWRDTWKSASGLGLNLGHDEIRSNTGLSPKPAGRIPQRSGQVPLRLVLRFRKTEAGTRFADTWKAARTIRDLGQAAPQAPAAPTPAA
ncbi:MAG: hypothetical protein MUF13_15860 [Akkermansiaceae bacterium]|nr:hypothetical protein [Akkermansiaceae bacterium]